MEEKKEKVARKFRGEAVIVKLLQEQVQSGQSIKSFCAVQGIAEGTFHNWKHNYLQFDSVTVITINISLPRTDGCAIYHGQCLLSRTKGQPT